jgi:flavin-binding protein dodecin
MSVYRVTEVIGVSEQSWEDATREAVKTAAGTVRDLRVAEVIRQDVTIENGQVKNFRVRLGLLRRAGDHPARPAAGKRPEHRAAGRAEGRG